MCICVYVCWVLTGCVHAYGAHSMFTIFNSVDSVNALQAVAACIIHENHTGVTHPHKITKKKHK